MYNFVCIETLFYKFLYVKKKVSYSHLDLLAFL